ncbi:MAG: MBL fold metallo-hydrolase [Oscillospiraceae bacterium]
MSISVKTLVLGPLSANSYLITDSQSGISAVIDPGEYNDAMKNEIKGKTIEYILLTHGHFDHLLGAADLKEATGAKIAIHEDDEIGLKSEKASLALWEYPDTQKFVSADILLKDKDKINLGKTEIKVMHTKGHTRGGVCYIIEEDRIIFSGDTLFCLTAGRTDFDGGSEKELMQSLKMLKNLEGDYTVYTGHNKSTTLDFERTHNRFMRKL